MDSLVVDHTKCNLCGACLDVCPFNAIELVNEKIMITAACKLCRLCIKSCPQQAIYLDMRKNDINKQDWQGIIIYAEYFEHQLHPVTLELIGIGRKLAEEVHMPVYCLLVGHDVGQTPDLLLQYGVDVVFLYEDQRLEYFCADSYTNVFADLITEIRPSVVLIGGTSIGRSLAPRVATRFRTGLTADCTTLKINKNTDLVQIRPAFGGNIMAQIITPGTRPQFATVRYKVMDRAPRGEPHGRIVKRNVSDRLTDTKIKVMRVIPKQAVPSITEADVLVVAGQGLKEKNDLALIKDLAGLLGGEYATTRPLIEKGWADYTRQIGLSGRTVKPKLIITCGVSGAIQFTACMNAAERIIAINTDRQAPIFKIAHYAIIGDLYTIVPALISKIRGAKAHAV